MIRVLSRTVRAVVVLVSLGAAVVPLGCKLPTKDNPDVCDLARGDGCADGKECVNHVCQLKGGGGGAAGKGGAVGSGGAGGRAMAGGGAGGGPGAGGAAGVDCAGGGPGIGGTGGPDAGVMDGGVDQADAMDAPVDMLMCTDMQTTMCPPGKNACKNGSCVECTGSANCPFSQPACDMGTNNCGSCTDDGPCSGRMGTPRCNTGHGCVECLTTADCMTGSTKKVCDTVNHNCVPCLESKDCPATTPICDTGTHTCGKCSTDKQCATLSDANRQYCDTGACVQCMTSAQCIADPKKPALP